MIPMFLDGSLEKTEALTGSYEPVLVVLSYSIAGLASFCALTIVKNNLGEENRGASRFLWHAIGAITMGTGIWAMHFLGMVAFRLPIPIEYDPITTIISILPAIFASWIVMSIVAKKELSRSDLILGGILMGGGIGTMHYSGMAGMRIDAMMYYESTLFGISIIVAIALSIVSLYTTYRLKIFILSRPITSRIIGSTIMGLAIGSMHYTGMSATYYFDTCKPEDASISGIDPTFLGATIAIASILVIGLTTIAGIVDHNFRATEASAIATQKILSRVLENTQQGYFRLNLKGEIEQLNPALCRILGLEKDTIIGKRLINFSASENREKLESLLSKLATGRFEISLVNAEQKNVPCLYHATETLDDLGLKNGIVGLLTDITELREREKQSQERANNITNVLDSLPAGVLLIDQYTNIQLFNESCEKMFGYLRNEIISQPISELIDHSSKQSLSKYISGLTPQNSRVDTVEFTALRKDGSSFPIEFGINEIIIDQQIMLVGAVIDITQRKHEQKRREELETELIHSSKLEAVGQLAGGIAHEINTPIQFIGDNLGYLETEFSSILPFIQKINKSANKVGDQSHVAISAAELRETLNEIDLEFIITDIPQAISQSIVGVKDVSRIVLSMKEFSHPGTEAIPSFNIVNAIENTVTISKAEWRNVANVKLDFAEDTPRISCVPGAINQVILNMVVNAAHAIADAKKGQLGRITISTKREDEVLLIQISDTGTGMPDDVKNKIFDPFFTTKKIGRGTGQGLAITWDIIVKKHNGTINLETTPGEGTIFSIRLPIDKSTQGSQDQKS